MSQGKNKVDVVGLSQDQDSIADVSNGINRDIWERPALRRIEIQNASAAPGGYSDLTGSS